MIKNLPANAGDTRDASSILGSARPPGEGNDNPLWYSCLENPWAEEPGGLQSMGSQRVGHDYMTEHTPHLSNLNTCTNTLEILPRRRC